MGQKAQIVKLDNAGLDDEEVVYYSDDFYELRELLENPVDYMLEQGKRWKEDVWQLLSPVTAIIRPLEREEERPPFLGFSPIPMFKVFDILGVLETDGETPGGFVAQFAKNTHTILITYQRPSATFRQSRNENITFTNPNLIELEQNVATLHFDFQTADDTISVNEMRANYVVDHLVAPDDHTWGLLGRKPLKSKASKVLGPNNKLSVALGNADGPEVSFKQKANRGVHMIVEGLSVSEPVVVCTFAGARWHDGHWWLDGDIVKNYRESVPPTNPPGGGTG